MKKIFAILMSMCFVATLSAHGKKDSEMIIPEDPKNWQETFSLEGHKKGTYNILVKASDFGGNEYIEGPYNIKVDPKSDLAITNIVNPKFNMHVQSNLNIVGSCVDDDAVDFVDIYLDGDEMNPVRAEGKEFWSYYLDTTSLKEGLHTIEVVGTDINGLQGVLAKTQWILDRQKPVTEVTNHGLGEIISGNATLAGVVQDGNRMKALEYSNDNGETWIPIKLARNKEVANFKFKYNTNKFEDGPAVLWFRGTDTMGTVGYYSYMCFIDNTKPDIKIIIPAEKEAQYGNVAIAGRASDALPLASVSWTWGKEVGDFELVPGNPYWSVVFDTTAEKAGSKKFTVTAIDIAGNKRVVSQNIPLNQTLNKPTAEIIFPTKDTNIKMEDNLFVRGIAHDKEGVKAVKYRLDNGEWTTAETQGVFYADIAKGSDLSAGRHTISIIPIDKTDCEGNTVSVTFGAQGGAPTFEKARITGGGGAGDYIAGMTVHPEAGSTFCVNAVSTTGLESVRATVISGGDVPGSEPSNPINIDFNNSSTVNIPIDDKFPKGVVKIIVTASDTAGRTRNFTALLDVVNTTVINSKTQEVVFSDSTIDSDGTVIMEDEQVSGYFIGGKAQSVELVPSTSFVTASLSGNQIIIKSSGAVGSSGALKVRVKTDEGLTFESKELTFIKPDKDVPEITLNDASSNMTLDIYDGAKVSITGNIVSSSGIASLSYKVYSSEPVIKPGAGAVSAMGEPKVAISNNLSREKSFYVPLDTTALPDGIHILEVTVRSNGGNKASAAMCFKKLPPLDVLPNGKVAKAANPMFIWVDGEDTYGVAAYQGESQDDFLICRKSEMSVGVNNLSMTSSVGGKPYSSKHSYTKEEQTITARIASVGGIDYLSGMPISVQKGAATSMKIFINTTDTISAINYEVIGADTPGGSNKSGSVKVDPSELGSYEVEIPLDGLPARMNQAKITIKAGKSTKELVGSFAIVRPPEYDGIDDERKIYLGAVDDTMYNKELGAYVLMNATRTFNFYANTHEIAEYELITTSEGLSTSRTENNITLTFDKDGSYKNVKLRVKDPYGATYMSDSINFTVDSNPPQIVISTPEYKEWVNDSMKITGTAVDPSGIKDGEYSIDGGVNWLPLNLSITTSNNGATFNAIAEIKDVEDGFVPLDVKISDLAGNVGYCYSVFQKDTTPPVVTKIMPEGEDVINGENILAFTAFDDGAFDKAYYVFPKTMPGEETRMEEVGNNNYITAHVGQNGRPIDENMQFDFVDAAGNHTILSNWDFVIDREKDLPVATVQMPQENEVLTRDFNITGVVFDDDGPCKVYYRIDSGEYICVDDLKKDEEVAKSTSDSEDSEDGAADGEEAAEPITKEEMLGKSSFSIPIDFSTMTDNEHTISVYAVDINGLKGNVMERKIRISTEEPKGEVVTPEIDKVVRQVITINGTASDNNGIGRVDISLDNGNTYNSTILSEEETEGATTPWSYEVDTRSIVNGINVVFIKVYDKYDIQALYSSIINIDNLRPEIILESPKDDVTTTGLVMLTGYAFDNIDIADLHLTIRSLDGKSVPSDMRLTKLDLERIIAKKVDMSALENGLYNLELKALDKAGNETTIARNVMLDKQKPLAVVNTYYPMNGEEKQGEFNIYGEVIADKPVNTVSLYIDDQFMTETKLTKTGFYKFAVDRDLMEEGDHTYYIEASLEDNTLIRGRTQTVKYRTAGPYVTVDNFTYGDFAYDRPFLRGHAGYGLTDEEIETLGDKKATKAEKAALNKKKVQRVELSFNNGRTWKQVSHGAKWRYRIENTDIAEGYHFFLVRATMADGSVAIDRTIIQIDHTLPTVRLIAPVAGGHYNQELLFSGLANDNVELKDVKLLLRKGDKFTWGVPGFLQGLYIDAKFWGATLFDVGVGLTFFDNNVKLQVQWGEFTQAQRDVFENNDLRYGGDVIGLKILANIARIPFGSFCGHDWDWLSADFAIGANFSYFTESASGKGQFLSAIVIQLEFPKIHWPKAKCWKVFSFYTEFSLWFIPSDIEDSGSQDVDWVVPQWSEGIRLNVF